MTCDGRVRKPEKWYSEGHTYPDAKGQQQLQRGLVFSLDVLALQLLLLQKSRWKQNPGRTRMTILRNYAQNENGEAAPATTAAYLCSARS